MPTPWAPAALISSTIAATPAALRPPTARRAPRSANLLAVARPMPEAAPLMTTTCWSKGLAISPSPSKSFQILHQRLLVGRAQTRAVSMSLVRIPADRCVVPEAFQFGLRPGGDEAHIALVVNILAALENLGEVLRRAKQLAHVGHGTVVQIGSAQPHAVQRDQIGRAHV